MPHLDTRIVALAGMILFILAGTYVVSDKVIYALFWFWVAASIIDPLSPWRS